MATSADQRRRLAAVVNGWVGRGVLVVGDAMLDEWRFADSDRLCREAPAPVLTLRRRLAAAGGAANTAVNLAALGGRAALVAPVGTDVAGDELHDCLDRAGVWDRTVSQPGRPTPVKRRLLAGDQILVREDEGDADGTLSGDATDRLLGALAHATDELRAATREVPALVICDYGLGALPARVRAWLIRNRELFTTVALDAHDLTQWRALAPTVVTPSFAEATRLLGSADAGTGTGPARRRGRGRAGTEATQVTAPDRLTVDHAPGSNLITVLAHEEIFLAGTGLGRIGGDRTGPDRPGGERRAAEPAVDRVSLAEAHLAELRERTGADVVAVTLDADGAIVGGADGRASRSHSIPVPASHAVGAGDAYLAAMTLALAAEAPLALAAQLAQLTATITVSETGTCVCVRDDLLAALGPVDEDATPTVVGPVAVAQLVERHRRAGRRIVFTNGCFDVLHRGHVGYLEQARELGDVLVVAVNSDGSVRRLKGPDRPVNPVEDRVAVLAALACVDHVVVFEEDSPARLIEAVRPDVYVKGGDYPPDLVPEAPLVRHLGGQVRTLGYVPDRSTSAIIDRIRSQAAERRADGQSAAPVGRSQAAERRADEDAAAPVGELAPSVDPT